MKVNKGMISFKAYNETREQDIVGFGSAWIFYKLKWRINYYGIILKK